MNPLSKSQWRMGILPSWGVCSISWFSDMLLYNKASCISGGLRVPFYWPIHHVLSRFAWYWLSHLAQVSTTKGTGGDLIILEEAGFRARHFFAMLSSRLMLIVMIVCVEHENACDVVAMYSHSKLICSHEHLKLMYRLVSLLSKWHCILLLTPRIFLKLTFPQKKHRIFLWNGRPSPLYRLHELHCHLDTYDRFEFLHQADFQVWSINQQTHVQKRANPIGLSSMYRCGACARMQPHGTSYSPLARQRQAPTIKNYHVRQKRPHQQWARWHRRRQLWPGLQSCRSQASVF